MGALTVVPIPNRPWASWIVVVLAPAASIAAIVGGLLSSWRFNLLGGIGALWMNFPAAIRSVRIAAPSITVEDDRVVIDHGSFKRRVAINRDDLHSIVPIWLPRSFSIRKNSPVVSGRLVPAVGTPERRSSALVFVLREERTVVGRREPVRGFVVVVGDLDAAQRAVQHLGLLARLTPGAFDWLHPTSKASSPGPLPVYGT